MPLRLQETLRRVRFTRLIVCVIVLTVALVLQHKLTTIPLVGDINAQRQFADAPVLLNQEKLVIEGPVVTSADRVLFAYEGGKNRVVDVHLPTTRIRSRRLQRKRSTSSIIKMATQSSARAAQTAGRC